ncbi:MAG: ATP-dependent sacrificial sulfur transferase LarE [Acidobacteriota bacterium]
MDAASSVSLPSSLPSCTAADKEQALRDWLRRAQRLIVALSGGVDSTYLAFVAHQELGGQALLATGDSPSLARLEQEHITQFVTHYGMRHIFVNTHELSHPAYQANSVERCYFCKQELFSQLWSLARQEGIRVVCDGTNADDEQDVRPGRRAAAEQSVASPLAELGFTKADIRERARHWGLPTADKPASPCLASRIPHGQPVTIGKLLAIERGEQALRELGFHEVRLRHHGDIVRVEVAPAELPQALNPDMAARLVAVLKPLGFHFITLDLEGFRSGSLSRVAVTDPQAALSSMS